MFSLAAGLAAMAVPQLAYAGGQIEEPLGDAVRNAMVAAIHSSEPPDPVFSSTESRLHYLRWKIEMNRRLVNRKSAMVTLLERDDFLKTVWYNCRRSRVLKVDPELVLGIIQVESNFRRLAISSAGARGFMQVMPFWARLLGDGDASHLFQMQTNLRFGCVILGHYLERENGNLFMALGRYNGSRGKSPYPDAVLAAARQWVYLPGQVSP